MIFWNRAAGVHRVHLGGSQVVGHVCLRNLFVQDGDVELNVYTVPGATPSLMWGIVLSQVNEIPSYPKTKSGIFKY